MNFVSVNEPESFVFHDGYFEKIIFIESDMLWNVSDICVEKNNSQNSNECAMGIEKAEVIFKSFRIDSANVDGAEMKQEEWNEVIAYCGESHPYFAGLDSAFSSDGIIITAEFIFENSLVSMTIFCTEFIVSWDNFKGRAWYDKEKKDGLFKRVIEKIVAKNEE